MKPSFTLHNLFLLRGARKLYFFSFSCFPNPANTRVFCIHPKILKISEREVQVKTFPKKVSTRTVMSNVRNANHSTNIPEAKSTNGMEQKFPGKIV